MRVKIDEGKMRADFASAKLGLGTRTEVRRLKRKALPANRQTLPCSQTEPGKSFDQIVPIACR